jgi:hypothetical protein
MGIILLTYLIYLFSFETGSSYVAQAGLELGILLPLPLAITGMDHYY